MGFGDVKLGLVLGLFTGWLALDLVEAPYLAVIALFFGGIIGVVIGFVVALSRGRKAAFPFGPALCARGVPRRALLEQHRRLNARNTTRGREGPPVQLIGAALPDRR